MGFSLIFLPSTVIITSYFRKRRAFATSICACGADVGTFTFATIIHFLDDNFGWEYSVMILGVILLTCTPLSVMLKPIQNNESDLSIGQTDMASMEYRKDVSETGNVISGWITKIYHKTSSSFSSKGKIYVKLFLDAKFSIFVASNFLTCLGITVPIIYTVVRITT